MTPGSWATRDAISSRSASPLAVRRSMGDSMTRNWVIDGVFGEVAVEQLVALVAGGAGGLSCAVIIADLHSARNRRQP